MIDGGAVSVVSENYQAAGNAFFIVPRIPSGKPAVSLVGHLLPVHDWKII